MYKFDDAELPENAKALKDELLKAINLRFDKIEENNIFAEATFLDPRFKKYGFSNAVNFENIKELIITKLTALSDSNAEILHAVEAGSENNSQNTSSADRDGLKTIWTDFDCSVSALVKNADTKDIATIEVDKYLQEPLLNRSEDPLLWWQHRENVYPRLVQLAKKRLCILGTSVPSERVFSKAGQLITDRRNRLSGKRVSQILFLHGNL